MERSDGILLDDYTHNNKLLDALKKSWDCKQKNIVTWAKSRT